MTLEVEPEEEPTAALSPWDRRVLQAMATAKAARTGVIALRVLAGVIAVATLIGNLLWVLEFSESGGGFGSVDTPTREQIAQYLVQVASPLAFAGLVFAASYLLAVYAARLDLDIVLSDDDESRRAPNG